MLQGIMLRVLLARLSQAAWQGASAAHAWAPAEVQPTPVWSPRLTWLAQHAVGCGNGPLRYLTPVPCCAALPLVGGMQDCSVDIQPFVDPACADVTNTTVYPYDDLRVRAYYSSPTTIRSVLPSEAPNSK